MKKNFDFWVFSHPTLKKLIMELKIAFLIIVVGVSNALATPGYSQVAKVSLDMENRSLEQVMDEIESQSEFYFIFNQKQIDVNRVVDIQAENKLITDILPDLFDGTNVNYTVLDRKILLTTDPVEKSLLAISSGTILQQNRIEGTVTGKDGSPLPGVNVVVTGTTQGAITDIAGKYSIEVPQGSKSLRFSFIGLEDQEITIGSLTQINVTMAESAIGLEEVVVIGYGSQRKATLTGSVANITNKELKTSPNINISNAISGLLPGVITEVRSGEPGRDNASILIRGRSTTGNVSPLVVVDGIQGYSGWERINSNDIESISILKDASAAIYGARAANGVILITTKRGTTGKPVIDYTFNQAITQPTRLPDLADSYSYAGYVNELLIAQGQVARYTEEELQKFKDGSDPLNYPNTDWYKEVLAKHSFQSQQNLSVRGGSENIKYSVSGSYTNQGGIFKNGSTNFKTYSLRSNVDAQINKNLKVGFDVNGSLDEGNYPTISVSQTFYLLNNVPMVPVFYPNGLPSSGIQTGQNPAISATDKTGNINNSAQRYQAKLSFDLIVPWIKGLGVDGYFNYSNNISYSKTWNLPYTVYDYDKTTDKYIGKPGNSVLRPTLSESFNRGRSTLLNLRVKYEKQFNDHKISAFIAGEQSEGKDNNFNGFRKDFISSTLDQLFAGSLVGMSNSGSASASGRQNLLGRVSYGFKDKYLLDVNLRYDGSSVFPPGNQWGFFPGASVAWRISQENFMKNNVSFVDNLKLRASYGKIGNDAVSAFQFLQLYTLSTAGSSWGQTPVQSLGLAAGVSPNPNITWEVLNTANVGLDASLWNGLLGLTVDLFKQTRSNILATRDLAVPIYTQLNLPSENIGIVENKGIELELTHRKVLGDFSYRIAGNVGYYHNTIIDVSEPQNVPEWQKAEGHELGANLYYHAIGIFRTQAEVDAAPIYLGTKVGDLQYEDVNSDGKITVLDMVRMDRSNIPDITFGLNFSVNYKSLFLSANFTGQARAWQFIHKEARLGANTLQDLITNRYTQGSMDSKYPTLPLIETYQEVSGLQSTFWLKDATFARLKVLELGYNLPQNLLSKLKITNLRIFVNGNNLFTLDKLKWYDPEGDSETGQFHPQNKIYNLGINLTF